MKELNTVLINNRNFGIDYKKDLSKCEMHTHSFIEIAYTLSGKAIHILNGKSELIKENEYVVIEPGSRHQYIKIGTEDLSIINCIFTASFPYPCATANSFYECLQNPSFNINSSNIMPDQVSRIYYDSTGMVRQLFLLLQDEYKKKDYKYEIISRRLLNVIILLTVRSLNPGEGTSTYISETVKDYVSIHYAEHNVLQVLAERLSYSIPYLSKKFKAETGESFKSFQQKIRINEAASLLIQTNRSIDEISNLVGYTDIKYFIKVFTKKQGMSPSKFKKKYGSSINKSMGLV
ncbi:MAG: helix-turn-helix domain-containing protein [Clostridia bacterium]|nr:helix-turn-helix domain-containing protein [Clostridia bacterium]